MKRKASRTELFKASKDTKLLAKFVALVVRNAMEDFHVKNLTNEQMKELNPLIRNAVCSALHAYVNYGNYKNAKDFVDFGMMSIPPYWEEPEIDEFLQRERGTGD